MAENKATMTKSDLVKMVSVKAEITQSQARKAVNATLETIGEHLQYGERVLTHPVGIFKTTVRKSRICRNPKTGELIQAPEKIVIKFKPSTTLKRLVN